MQRAVLAVTARGDAGMQEDLNRFLRSHRVLTMHREFVAQGDNSFWALRRSLTPTDSNKLRFPAGAGYGKVG